MESEINDLLDRGKQFVLKENVDDSNLPQKKSRLAGLQYLMDANMMTSGNESSLPDEAHGYIVEESWALKKKGKRTTASGEKRGVEFEGVGSYIGHKLKRSPKL